MASTSCRSPRPARGSSAVAARANPRSPRTAASTVSSWTATCRRSSSASAPGALAWSRPRTPSPSTRQIDSTTASWGRSGHWPWLGMLAGISRLVPVSSESMTGATSSPESQVANGRVPASTSRTSATYPSWCSWRAAIVVSSIPQPAPHPDDSVRTHGTNSARCRSLAPSRAPKRSNKVSVRRCRRQKSSVLKGSASGRPGSGTRAARPPCSSTNRAMRSNPSSPSTPSAVMTGKWFTPVTVGTTAVWGRPSAIARSMQKLPTS